MYRPLGVRYSLGALAVHVVLDREQVRSILSLYHLDDLEEFAGIAEGSINTAYWVRADGRKLFLRITEKKRVQDMVFEKELLDCLADEGLPVPRLLRNVAGGTFTPWSAGGRFVSLFEFMPGRELGAFEVRPEHAEQVGRFAARMHLTTRDFPLRRDNEFRIDNLAVKTDELIAAVEEGRLSGDLMPDLSQLRAELECQRERRLDLLPRGTVHGDLFIDNAKFEGDLLVGIIDFEMSSSERLLWELGVMINAWCWEPSSSQQGGPAGSFDRARMHALLQGYQSVRALETPEKNALSAELRLAAARFAITRLYDFELNPLPADRRVYKDYRHYMARLHALGQAAAGDMIAGALK